MRWPASPMTILHVPDRSYQQVARKVTNGAAGIAANPLLAGVDGPLNAEQEASLGWVQRGGQDRAPHRQAGPRQVGVAVDVAGEVLGRPADLEQRLLEPAALARVHHDGVGCRERHGLAGTGDPALDRARGRIGGRPLALKPKDIAAAKAAGAAVLILPWRRHWCTAPSKNG